MKISKLFHWLYGLVMLLPIFAIGSACLISTFNMASKEENEIHYKYETNEVNSANDLILGRAYHFEINNDTADAFFTDTTNISLLFYNVTAFNFEDYTFYFDEIIKSESSLDLSLNFVFGPDWNGYYYSPNNINAGYLNAIGIDQSLDSNSFTLIGDCIIDNFENLENSSPFSKCENIPIDYVETHNVSAQDVFYDSIDKVTSHPLFSWAYNSFLATPFVYIATLFSIPSNSVIIQLLSYWLAISVIWLVFDLIMYVPLLVHRWIDKGVLE